MKRIWTRCLSVLLAVILLVGMVQAAQTPELTVSSGSAKPGESVLLKVSIKNNPGIAAAKLYIYYDTETFTVDLDKDMSAAGKFASAGGLLVNTIAKAKENGRYEGKADKDGVLAVWYNGMGKNTTNDGVVLTVQLHVKKTASNGDYTVQVDPAGQDTVDERGMPVVMKTSAGTVTVTGAATEKQPDSEAEPPEAMPDTPVVEFTDVSGNWAERYIKQAAELRLIEGYEGKYRPNDTMTRAEFVTILWRAVGSPKPTKKASFKDLKQDWYLDSVAWAEENAVVNGMGEGKFAPNGTVTREQMVTIFHRMAGTPMGMEAMLTGIYDGQYPDSGKVGAWAKSALYWSIYNGIYCGVQSETVGKTLEPKMPASRAQIAVMIVRYLDLKD